MTQNPISINLSVTENEPKKIRRVKDMLILNDSANWYANPTSNGSNREIKVEGLIGQTQNRSSVNGKKGRDEDRAFSLTLTLIPLMLTNVQ